MKILGVSIGAENDRNDVVCKTALLAAQEAGAEVEFIRLSDWHIEPCTGCASCSEGLVRGKGNACVIKDDFDAFRDILLDADGVLFVSPSFETGASGLLRTVGERLGPRTDRGLNAMYDRLSRKARGQGADPRLMRGRAVSFIGVGSADVSSRVLIDHALIVRGTGWMIIDNEAFPWSADIVMQDGKLARAGEIGRNLACAAADLGNARYMGGTGVCPHCGNSGFWLEPGTTKAVCEFCGLEGEVRAEDGAWRFIFPPEDAEKARDTLAGRMIRADDIRDYGEQVSFLTGEPAYRERKERYRELLQPVPPPADE